VFVAVHCKQYPPWSFHPFTQELTLKMTEKDMFRNSHM